MKAFTALILVCLIVSVPFIASTVGASGVTKTGVKKGDWIEYTINISGPPLDQARNLTWYKNEILEVNGTSFQTNMTSISVNGTVLSTIWHFNLTEGQVQGWEIIPANLGVGDTFFAVSKNANITVVGQEQKIVAGASRTVTHATDPGKLVKEWDKATGVYVHSLEWTRNYTVVTNAIATNMWSPQTQAQNQTGFYLQIAVATLLAVIIFFLVFVAARRKRSKKPILPHLSQGKIAVLTIFAVVLAEISFIFFFPFYPVGLSFAEINLIMQTVWTALIFVSLWLRIKGNYFLHEITMLIVMSAWLVGFSAVLMMDPLSSNSTIFSSSTTRVVMDILHAFFSVPALAIGLWLVILWRPESTLFAAKSKRIAQALPVFWVLSYAVGIVDFLLLHTTLLG